MIRAVLYSTDGKVYDFPGFQVTGSLGLGPTYERYLADEGTREALNALLSRGTVVLAEWTAGDGGVEAPGPFPVLTAAELELRKHPIVPEMGGMYVLSEEPDDDQLATGQGAIWITTDDIHGLTVRAKSKGKAASLQTDGLNFIARKPGQDGNNIAVGLSKPDDQLSPLSVALGNIDGGPVIEASLGTTGDGTQGVLYFSWGANAQLRLVAKEAGEAGNQIRLTLLDLGSDAVEDSSLNVVTVDDPAGFEIDVTLAQSTLTQPFMETHQDANAQDVRFESTQGAAANNAQHVRVLGPDDGLDDPIELFVYNGYVQIHFAAGQTVQDLLDWAETNPASAGGTESPGAHNLNDYVTITRPAWNSAGNGDLAVWGDDSTVLSGYSAPAVTATCAEIAALINGDDDASAIVTADTTGGDGSGLIGDFDVGNNLQGGHDADEVGTVWADLASALSAIPEIDALVAIEVRDGQGGNPAETLSESLSGGSDTYVFGPIPIYTD